MKRTKEEIFRIEGKPVAVTLTKSGVSFPITLLQLFPCILNKDELLELINWLITKSEDM